MEDNTMNELVGRTIRSVEVNDDETLLRFQCDEGPVTFEVEGDCCSSSWFADLVGYDALIGRPVVKTREVELVEGEKAPRGIPTTGLLTASGRSRQEDDKIYGYVIITDRGRCTIAFRNSSNGWYGGSIRFSTATHKGAKWRTITDDWSAVGSG
jgi:hypothetical protein